MMTSAGCPPCCFGCLLMATPPDSDEDERVALDDGDDLGALADQGGDALQGVAGQRAAGATTGHGDREGPDALVVGAGAAEGPPVGRVESLVQGLGGPALGDRGQVDRADGQRVRAPELVREVRGCVVPASCWPARIPRGWQFPPRCGRWLSLLACAEGCGYAE